MTKANKGKSRELREQVKRTGKSLRRLERRLDELGEQHRMVMERLERLTDDLATPFGGVGGRARFDVRRVAGGPGAWPPGRPPWGAGPRRRGAVPIASVEVPLETQDPTAPLWATVSARLPEEITVVDDGGHLVRYRYSAAGSTPQAPRYRRLADQFPQPPPPFPG